MKYLSFLAALLLSLSVYAQPTTGPTQKDVETVRALQNDVDQLNNQLKALKDQLAEKQAKLSSAKQEHQEAKIVLEKKQIENETQVRQRFAGVFTFANIIIVIAAIFIVVALGWIFAPVLLRLPAEGHELLIYGACGLAFWKASATSPEMQLFWIMPASLALCGGFWYTRIVHLSRGGEWDKPYGIWLFTAVCWGFIAICFQSQVIGFISVAALLASLGFSGFFAHGVIGIGFSEEDMLPQATLGALVLLVIYVLGSIFNHSMPPQYVYFAKGFGFLGCFVYFLGLLIVSSKWYCEDYNYLVLQILTVASGAAAFYLGSVYGGTVLGGIGGTFFAIYLLEKYIEIPWNDLWGMRLLILGGILYGIAWYAKNNPQQFIWGQ